MNIDAVLNDLVALARRQPSLDLIQFKTFVSAEQYRRLYELVEDRVPSGGVVLDWGCGNGHVTYALSALGYEPHAYSVDHTPTLAQLMPGRFRNRHEVNATSARLDWDGSCSSTRRGICP